MPLHDSIKHLECGLPVRRRLQCLWLWASSLVPFPSRALRMIKASTSAAQPSCCKLRAASSSMTWIGAWTTVPVRLLNIRTPDLGMQHHRLCLWRSRWCHFHLVWHEVALRRVYGLWLAVLPWPPGQVLQRPAPVTPVHMPTCACQPGKDTSNWLGKSKDVRNTEFLQLSWNAALTNEDPNLQKPPFGMHHSPCTEEGRGPHLDRQHRLAGLCRTCQDSVRCLSSRTKDFGRALGPITESRYRILCPFRILSMTLLSRIPTIAHIQNPMSTCTVLSGSWLSLGRPSAVQFASRWPEQRTRKLAAAHGQGKLW